MSIRYSKWTGTMARIMHAMAVLGYLGPAGLSVAMYYLSVLFELAAKKGAEFAIAYDRDLRRHLKRQTVAVEDVAPFLNTPDDARAAALQRSFESERNDKADKARQSLPAGGKGGGKGGNSNPSGRDSARNHGQDCSRNRGRNDNRDNCDKRQDKGARG